MMYFIIWLVCVIYLANYFQKRMNRNQEKIISETTYLDEVVVDGKKKTIQRDKCPNCGNKKMHYKGARQTAVYEYKFAVCNKCGTSFRVMHKPTTTSNGIFAFFLSLIICIVIAIVLLLAVSMIIVL